MLGVRFYFPFVNVDKNEFKTMYKKKAIKRPRPTTKRCNIVLASYVQASSSTLAKQQAKQWQSKLASSKPQWKRR